MDRLTHINKGMAWYKSDLLLLEPSEMSHSQISEVLNRLAAYEDTGLTPEEMKAAAELIDTVRKEVPVIHKNLSEVVHGEGFGRFKELAKADKAGRVLDYVPGDTVYDRFGMAWTVTSSEIHKFGDGPLRYLYRCGHPGTDDYCALYSEEICQKPEGAELCVCCGEIISEGQQVCPACETEAGL